MKKLLILASQFSTRKGFTLIELLITIAVIGVLSAGVLTAINPLKRIQQAQDAGIKSDIGQIANAMQIYYTASSIDGKPHYPLTVSALVPGELKIEPKIPPLRTNPYSVTGAKVDGTTACTITDRDCANVTVYAQLNETDIGYWCWASATGLTKISTSAPAATAIACP